MAKQQNQQVVPSKLLSCAYKYYDLQERRNLFRREAYEVVQNE